MTRDEEAVAILKENDRGTFSVPTKGLYPFQWNWDSAFSALGYAHFDDERAVAELETLAASQWADGMIPHIIFHQPDEGYFPGPEVWQSGTTPASSGITQPPVLMIAAARLAARGILRGARLHALVRAAERWHRWFQQARLDPGTGAVGVIHPWESGRDNAPVWDAALAVVDTAAVAPFKRRDLGHIDAAMRPTDAQYRGYIALVEFGRAAGWDQAKIWQTTPFAVADPGMTAILIMAEDALCEVADAEGMADVAAAARERRSGLVTGLGGLWSDDVGAPVTRDLRTGVTGTAVSSASFMALGPGVLRAGRRARLLAHFDRIADRATYMVPSWDPDAPGFDEKRYWRGPVWLVVNWLIADALNAAGDHERAERVRRDSRSLVERGGFFEYFSPLTGEPLGGDVFTWTAAAWLDFAREHDGAH